VRDPREARDVERVGVVAVDRVAGAEYAAVRVLDRAAHGWSLM